MKTGVKKMGAKKISLSEGFRLELVDNGWLLHYRRMESYGMGDVRRYFFSLDDAFDWILGRGEDK